MLFVFLLVWFMTCRSVPDEEREAKYVRVLTSSLLALKKLLTSLPKSDYHACTERLAHIIAQAKFWKFSKHKSPQVSPNDSK